MGRVADRLDFWTWLADIITRLAALAESDLANPSVRRGLFAQPNIPIKGPTAERKGDGGLVSVTLALVLHFSLLLTPRGAVPPKSALGKKHRDGKKSWRRRRWLLMRSGMHATCSVQGSGIVPS